MTRAGDNSCKVKGKVTQGRQSQHLPNSPPVHCVSLFFPMEPEAVSRGNQQEEEGMEGNELLTGSPGVLNALGTIRK